VIADSRDALRFDEPHYPPVYYFPRQDVMMERLERSSHESFCAYKGYATYYSIKNGPENAVWSYEDPYDRMRALEGRYRVLCRQGRFDPDRLARAQATAGAIRPAARRRTGA
jgi:uncharacterized protein (DUF427 family)